MEAAHVPEPSIKERPLDQFQLALQALHEGESLNETELYNLSLLFQTKYIDAFFTSKKAAEEQMTEWIIDGFTKTFRDFWTENKLDEEAATGEGFRDLCLLALKEQDDKKQRVIFEEVSRRLKDDMLIKEKGNGLIH